MKTDINDPWCGIVVPDCNDNKCNNHFEDSFVEYQSRCTKLVDSEEYLQKLYSRLRNLEKETSKKDLVASLAEVKEDYITRLITSGHRLEIEEETELTLNPLIRHLAPHLQAVTASELVHLLKADVLQVVTETENNKEIIENSLMNK
ncbi:uncharacterized protein LOC128872137 [Hylaeus volcanicus]|uniref:uncharacterized protein LOC128872137 n=1 Tax=Hylaeus volcanicus TaxID=313075 RepID=UPI0023B848AA|nr:uncharacterized protein LOC128872137 [Hylaeus volcanicus]